MKKVVGTIQSNYLPWRGYFDFIQSCDVFVFLDDVQYTKRDWRNRNRVKTKSGIQWISVPVIFSRTNATTIENTPVNHLVPWVKENIDMITEAYAKAPFFKEYSLELFEILRRPTGSISELNISLIRWAMQKLNIKTEIISSSALKTRDEKSLRILDIVLQLQGSVYLTGPAAKDYLQEDLFLRSGIQVEYKTYNYKPYPQLFGTFEDHLSIIDLLFNAGSGSYLYLQNQS